MTSPSSAHLERLRQRSTTHTDEKNYEADDNDHGDIDHDQNEHDHGDHDHHDHDEPNQFIIFMVLNLVLVIIGSIFYYFVYGKR